MNNTNPKNNQRKLLGLIIQDNRKHHQAINSYQNSTDHPLSKYETISSQLTPHLFDSERDAQKYPDALKNHKKLLNCNVKQDKLRTYCSIVCTEPVIGQEYIIAVSDSWPQFKRALKNFKEPIGKKLHRSNNKYSVLALAHVREEKSRLWVCMSLVRDGCNVT